MAKILHLPRKRLTQEEAAELLPHLLAALQASMMPSEPTGTALMMQYQAALRALKMRMLPLAPVIPFPASPTTPPPKP